jgi:hypothetical protein
VLRDDREVPDEAQVKVGRGQRVLAGRRVCLHPSMVIGLPAPRTPRLILSMSIL